MKENRKVLKRLEHVERSDRLNGCVRRRGGGMELEDLTTDHIKLKKVSLGKKRCQVLKLPQVVILRCF